MRIDTGQHLRMSQQMKLAPRMIQSMEILQLPMAALEERIEQELSNNPTLELREPGVDVKDLEAQRDQERRDASEGERELVVKDDKVDASHADDFERLTNISEEYGEAWEANNYESYRPARDTGEPDAKMEAMANTIARPRSLAEQLLEQWSLVEATPPLRRAGEYLIGQIDDDGYIRAEWNAIVEQAPRDVDRAVLDEALALLQRSLEPVGIAARDFRECLLLQIDALAKADQAGHNGEHPPDLTVERLIVSDFLKDVEMNRLPRIAQATGLTIEQVKTAIHNLRQFHPHPGRLLVQDQPQTIRPDVIVEYDEESDRYVARLAQDRLPSVHINPHYVKMARDRSVDRKTRQFVGNNLRSARWLIDAIRQRHHTLLRVVHVVLEAQREFFDQGPQHLRPLPMTQVADQLGIHVATVSRAVSEKYLQTPRGIFPLRMFFSGGTATDTGDQMSWAAVQAKLNEVIDAEDKQNPLNDDELVEKLKEKGIEIARRTVAKYRKQLNIPPARQRKQF